MVSQPVEILEQTSAAKPLIEGLQAKVHKIAQAVSCRPRTERTEILDRLRRQDADVHAMVVAELSHRLCRPPSWQQRVSWLMMAMLPLLVAVLGFWVLDQQQRYVIATGRMHLYYDIMKHSRDGIIVMDEFGVIEDWNEGATKLFGLTAAQAVGRPATIIIPPASRAQHESILLDPAARQKMLDGEVRIINCWVLGKDSPIWASIRLQAVQNSRVHYFAQVNYDSDVSHKIVDEVTPKAPKPGAAKGE